MTTGRRGANGGGRPGGQRPDPSRGRGRRGERSDGPAPAADRVTLPGRALLSILVAFSAAACRARVGPESQAAPPPTGAASATPSVAPPTATAPQDVEALLAAGLANVSFERLEADVQALAAIPTRHVNSGGIRLAADFLLEGFRQAGDHVLPSEYPFPLEFGGMVSEQRNIVARIPGWDEAAGSILIGAHYDSRTVSIDDWASPAPGANDNATGVASLLEIARLLNDFRPRATILLVAFSAEETGLQGSRHYVVSGVPEQEGLRAMLDLDIIGNSAGEAGAGTLRVFAGGGPGSSSLGLATWLRGVAEAHVPDLEVLVQDQLDRPGRYSDHVSFFEAGIPSVRLIEDLEQTELQHNADDRPERIDAQYLVRVTRLVLAAAFELSEDPLRFMSADETP